MNGIDLPDHVRLSPGDTCRFSLPAHGGGGYRWHSRVDGDSVAVSIDFEDDFPTGASPVPQRSVSQVVEIVAVRAGTATVFLEERRSWEKEAAATRVIDVHVRSADEQEEE